MVYKRQSRRNEPALLCFLFCTNKKSNNLRDKLRVSEQYRRAYEKIKFENSGGKDIDSSEYALSKTSFYRNGIN